MNTNRTFRILLAVLGFATVLGTAAITGGQVTQQVKKKQVVTAAYYPKLEVKQFSGDFTQWGLTDSIEKGGSLTKEFRWSTNRSDVAAARYEIRLYDFPAPATYQAAFRLVNKRALPQPLGLGAINYFTIDFSDLPHHLFVPDQPGQVKFHRTFHIRLVLLNAQGQALSPVSPTVKVDYTIPSGATWLDQVMKLRLKAVKCLSTTDGAGSDEIRIDIHGAGLSSKGLAKGLYRRFAGNVDDGWEIHPAALLWEYRGLGFRSNVYIIASLTESDGGLGSYEGPFPSITPNSGLNTTKLIAAITEQCNYGDGTIVGGSCIGPPQIIPVSQADWNKVALGGQTIERKIYFKGGKDVGGSYRLTFELSPK